ncbi:NADP-dependent oxidoreductase [Curtobacterium sp. MCPF17_046]|nr:NADP-dependent oxidoreductase [Curtobacterium sp. MCPF17_046]
MKAVRFHEFGGPEVLKIEDVPRPTAGPGEVLIEVAASGYNPADSTIREGAFQQVFPLELPVTPGFDLSGTVVTVGDGVDAFAPGEAVIGFLPLGVRGAAAEYAVAPVDVLAKAPTSIELADAAALPTAGMTALQALVEHGHLEAGQRVLVNGAGGAVGGYAIQLAVSIGAEVIATASPTSLERVTSYRPTQVIDHTGIALRDAIDGEVDLIVNFAPTDFTELLTLVKAGGRIVSASAPVEQDNAKKVVAVGMSTHADADQLAHLSAEVDAGRLRVWVENRRRLEDIADVHASNSSTGKTILLSH